MLLNEVNLRSLKAGVAKPAYDRAALKTGIVHLGPGAFHRAHQAEAFDTLNTIDPRWGITGVSLRSPDVREALQPQDGLYTLALLDEKTSFRVIGSIKEVLVAPQQPGEMYARFTAPDTRLVTLTITEKGYCLGQDGALDFNNADIKTDLANPTAPVSAIGVLVEAVRRRREAGEKPFHIISCDNLVDNGHKLRRAVLAFAEKRDAKLADYIAANIAFPCSMVDSITPATDDALRARVKDAIGLQDNWPIQREAFTQWVIERFEMDDAPDWAAAGVTMTDDVSAFERAKLRVLNASHSSLAYLGLLRGHETVFEAMADPALAEFVSGLMREDVAASLTPPPGLDLPAYIAAVTKRFRNPAIRHLLAQIAWDGSQKLPNRIFPLIQEALAAGRPIARPARTVAAWMRFVRGKALSGDKLVDPLMPLLLETGVQARDEAEGDVTAFLALESVFPPSLSGNKTFRASVTEAYADLIHAAWSAGKLERTLLNG